MSVAAALTATAADRADRLPGAPAAVGAFALVVLTYGIVRAKAWAVPWTLLALGAAYAAALFLPERGVDHNAPLYAAGLVLVGELGYWAIELRTPLSPEPGMLERRAAVVVAVTLGGLVASSVVVIASAAPVGGGWLWDAVGVVAAAAALAVVARLAQRGDDQSIT